MMSSVGDEENEVLSDVEADDSLHIDIKTPENLSVEKFREILAELDREKIAREAAENSKNDIQISFNRLKVLCHEALKKRDECSRQRDEAMNVKNEALREVERIGEKLNEETKLKEEALKQKDEFLRQLSEIEKVRGSSRVEMETGSSMLVSGIEKISRKVSNYKDFGGDGLPKSNKYSGLPAVAYGVIKRTNDIVEELVKQIELSIKSRNEARELVDLRNYEIAIEVSQLEATIDGWREEVAKKDQVIENLNQSIEEKNGKLDKLEREFLEKHDAMEIEWSRLRLYTSDYESKMETQRALLIDQLNFESRTHEEMCKAVKIVDAVKSSESSESLFLAQETNEENIRASLAGMESIYELSKIVVEKTRYLMEEKTREVKSLNESVSQLVKEKEQIGSLLRSTLSGRNSVSLSSKKSELFRVAKNGLREAGIDYQISKSQAVETKLGLDVSEEDEVYALASTLENISKQSQLEIIELKHSVDELRIESNTYKERANAQAKELNQWKQRVEELEEKERVANENVEGLMSDVVSADEEITRWKVAAQKEAAAGKAVEQEYVAQLTALRQELEEARQTVIELEKKLKFKEETAEAAKVARDAAEKSLKLADMRASRLRDRVEELTHQLDEVDNRDSSRTSLSQPRYICWPWQWLGMDIISSRPSETPQVIANEMELSEPLL